MQVNKEKQKKLLLVTRETALGASMVKTLRVKKYRVELASQFRSALEQVYLEPPHLLIIDEAGLKEGRQDILAWMDARQFQGRVSIVLIVDKGGLPLVSRAEKPALDDYLVKPFSDEELLIKVLLCFQRRERQWERNPLTLLPGNLSIIREIQRRLDAQESFALALGDLSDFKPYNDRYGFSRGDEVLRMTARIITNTVSEIAGEKGFVGHVGGDDFVFLVPAEAVDKACLRIIARFDSILPIFYDEEDRAEGYIVSHDRRGNENRFPLIVLSVGVAINAIRKFSHFGEVIQVANELRNYAKKWPGSHYCKDKRAG